MAGKAKLGVEEAFSSVLLAADGLLPSSQGTRVGHGGGCRFVLGGPFAETKELVGGYAIVEATPRHEAIELAQRVVDIRIGAG